MSVSPSTQNIRVGDTVSLTCELSSSYPPISAYRWYKDGVAVGSEQMLTLRGVRREDYGQYRCEAENAVGAGVAPAMTLYVFCKCQGSLPQAGALLEEERGHGSGTEFTQSRLGWAGAGTEMAGTSWRSRSWEAHGGRL